MTIVVLNQTGVAKKGIVEIEERFEKEVVDKNTGEKSVVEVEECKEKYEEEDAGEG
jgi:hypothetical protein